jgi:tol-pal system protein YbgF
MRYLILVCASLFAISPAAHAALFSDGEARESIKQLEQQVQAQNQANQKTLDELRKTQEALNQRLAEIEAVVKGQGLVELLNQVQTLNQELSRVKGQLEVAAHNIEMNQQRQRDLYTDIDGRLRKIEAGAVTPAMTPEGTMDPMGATMSTDNSGAPADAGSSVTATVAPTLAPPAGGTGSEAQDFENAQALYRAGKYREAFDAYEKFLQAYPNSSRAPEAQYALGYTQFSLKNYKAAMNTQQKMIKNFPNHARVPDAMFSIANSQIQLSDVEGAKQTLKTLLARYPNSDVAPNAKKRLAVLESIKPR